ncbi:MAG: aa3-type cytochrome oxidase subunit II [Sporichthyaceae bacterium]
MLLTSTGCDTAELPRLAFPTPATEEAPRILLLWQGSWLAAAITGGIVWALIIWSCVFHRKKHEAEIPIQSRYNLPIEVLYTVIPFIIVAVFFYFTARDESILLDMDKEPDLEVNVVGRQWSWSFNYLGEDVYDVGTPKDLPVLWLPVDKTVRFELTSPDVIHSFYVPSFLFKMDVFPGKVNKFQLTPNKIGRFAGKCSELCGTDHSRMLFEVNVVSEADYRAHLADLRRIGQTGQLDKGILGTEADRLREYNVQFSEREENIPIGKPEGAAHGGGEGGH